MADENKKIVIPMPEALSFAESRRQKAFRSVKKSRNILKLKINN
jgi:hypothetical protein